ncbi:hypothetical protein PR048_017634 [Dryococelus australis]|uniref:Uncharacterized protein n=1 Tax=Dryococelus australis TaxID=614101 RepID=A0ABQ9HA17_9NEOP|nr:hypothetical protein PR048_017634 [Dryococelus australis]
MTPRQRPYSGSVHQRPSCGSVCQRPSCQPLPALALISAGVHLDSVVEGFLGVLPNETACRYFRCGRAHSLIACARLCERVALCLIGYCAPRKIPYRPSCQLANSAGIKGWGKREIFEKTRRPAASSGTIPTCKSLGANAAGTEPGSSRWEASNLTTKPPRPLTELTCNHTSMFIRRHLAHRLSVKVQIRFHSHAQCADAHLGEHKITTSRLTFAEGRLQGVWAMTRWNGGVRLVQRVQIHCAGATWTTGYDPSPPYHPPSFLLGPLLILLDTTVVPASTISTRRDEIRLEQQRNGDGRENGSVPRKPLTSRHSPAVLPTETEGHCLTTEPTLSTSKRPSRTRIDPTAPFIMNQSYGSTANRRQTKEEAEGSSTSVHVSDVDTPIPGTIDKRSVVTRLGLFLMPRFRGTMMVKRDEYGPAPECKNGGNGRSRENSPTSSIVRHDSHMRKSLLVSIGCNIHIP